MEIRLSMTLSDEELEDVSSVDGLPKPSQEDFKEELNQRLFEVCEDWVLREQEPELIFLDNKGNSVN